MAHSPTPRRPYHPSDELVVVHDFDARGEDELTLRRGDKIELIELDDGFGDGWYLGRHITSGLTGLFPGVYTTSIPRLGVRNLSSPSPTGTIESHTMSTNDIERSTAALDLTARTPNSVSVAISNHHEEPPPTPKSAGHSGDISEITPQASPRRGSAPETEPIQLDDRPDSPTLDPPKRVVSNPLPAPPMPLASGLQKVIRESFRSPHGGEESPVMSETLSVIDEHITNLSTPRHSIATNQDRNRGNDSGSEYSSHISHRLSYIQGHETDEEEENSRLTEDQVRKWDHLQMAQHLRSVGVEDRHCDIFRDQEITGEVLLEMDQEFLFMKEFDFGVMGRRLKTWHKIKALQEEVNGTFQSKGRTPGVSTPVLESERSMSRTGHTGPLLPRIPTLNETQTISPQPMHQQPVASRLISSVLHSSPTSVDSGSNNGTFPRPSAASIRDLNHSRRHSSIDSTVRSPPVLASDSPVAVHQKQGSFDRGWTMAMGMPSISNRPATANEGATDDEIIMQQRFLEQPTYDASEPSLPLGDRLEVLERGYFSGGELDGRRARKVLRKRQGSGSISSRISSPPETPSQPSPAAVQHTRFPSADSSRDGGPVSTAGRTFHGIAFKGRKSKNPGTHLFNHRPYRAPTVPPVDEKAAGPSFFSPFIGRNDSESSGRSSPLPINTFRNVAPKFRRAVGLRASTEPSSEKDELSPSATSPTTTKELALSVTRTGSTTPSGTSKSSERHSTDGSGKAGDGSLPLSRPLAASKVGSKSKKDTSAYIRGLEKKSPQEQMLGCEYSGWMRKKSSHLMTTWKPRLFVLRGRRLSYYYSENDTEERGLIDITAHRVLRADQDPLISLHATITGAKSLPSPKGAGVNSITPNGDTVVSSTSVEANTQTTQKHSSEGSFIFKLVPPKSGLSRTVQFTKPTTHYFQVDSIQEGRLWMAALMKATIERDISRPVETTNKQKTISLKQARAMKQRPPALMGPPDGSASLTEDGNGLKIQGLNLDKASSNLRPNDMTASVAENLDSLVDSHEMSPSLPERLARLIT